MCKSDRKNLATHNITQGSSCNEGEKIPVHISNYRPHVQSSYDDRIPVLKTLKRNNAILQAIHLPVVMNINPRSLYNKAEDFKLLLEQYNASVVCISESWERDNFTLEQLLQLDNYKVITNVKQRNFKGGKPAILIKDDNYHIKELCPEPITVPVGVEAVWALISHKKNNPATAQYKVKHIAVGAIYYRGPKSTTKKELFDHIAETFHYLR